MIDVGDAAAFALWLDAAASGRSAPDEVSAAFPGAVVDNWPGEIGGVGVSMVAARLSALTPESAVVLVLAVPGDPGPLSAPADVVRTATTQGVGIALKPLDILLIPLADDAEPLDAASRDRAIGPRRWRAVPIDASTMHPPDRVETERQLRTSIREASDELERLDLAGGRDRIDPELLRRREQVLPMGVPTKRVALLDLAMRVHTVLDAADRDAGAAVSASALELRRAGLRDLRRHVRRAIEAAASTPSSAG